MLLDVTVCFVTVGAFGAFAFATFGPVDGAQTSLDLFGWHPVLMALAFTCLMPLGRWCHHLENGNGLQSDKGPQVSPRLLHRAFNMAATLAMLAGYVATVLTHWPQKVMLGYDFENEAWKEWRKVAHIYVGYATILLVFLLAFMGIRKMQHLRIGNLCILHRSVGTAGVFLGAIDILLAIWFSKWSDEVKVLLGSLVILTSSIGLGKKAEKAEPLLRVT